MGRITKTITMEGEFGKPPEKVAEIDYSKMSSDELLSRIRSYETKHSSYDKFSEDIDCGYSSFEELCTQDDWYTLLEERRQRVLEGKIKICLNSKPATFQEIMKTTHDKQKPLYEILRELEKKGMIKKYIA